MTASQEVVPGPDRACAVIPTAASAAAAGRRGPGERHDLLGPGAPARRVVRRRRRRAVGPVGPAGHRSRQVLRHLDRQRCAVHHPHDRRGDRGRAPVGRLVARVLEVLDGRAGLDLRHGVLPHQLRRARVVVAAHPRPALPGPVHRIVRRGRMAGRAGPVGGPVRRRRSRRERHGARRHRRPRRPVDRAAGHRRRPTLVHRRRGGHPVGTHRQPLERGRGLRALTVGATHG